MAEIAGAEIERKRGDTAPDVIVVMLSDGETPRDITGYSYRLTVNREKRPSDTDEQLATSVGQITDAAGGEVSFPWAVGDADQEPGKYWYDIEQTDPAGLILTIAKNRYIFYQDISK